MNYPEVKEPRDKQKTHAAIDTLARALEAKTIYNAEWKEAKEILSRVFESDANNLASKLMDNNPNKQEGYNQWNAPIDYKNYSALYTLKSMIKLMEKANQKEHPFKAEYAQFIDYQKTWLIAVDLIEQTKPFIVMGRKPSEKPSDVYIPPAPSKNAVVTVRKVLEEIENGFRDKLKEQFFNTYMNVIQVFLKNRKSNENPYNYAKARNLNSFYYGLIQTYTTYTDMNEIPRMNSNWSGDMKLKDGAEAKIKEAADKDGEEAMLQFLEKNIKKIASIVNTKQNNGAALITHKVVSSNYNRGIMESQTIYSFSDNTRFTVDNKVVVKLSTRGRPFYQFPTTFHDVVFKTGQKAAMVSEEDMNEKWAKE